MNRCPGCGADHAADTTVCQYCGAHLAPPSLASSDLPKDRRGVFERIKKSPQYAKSNSPERQAQLPQVQAIHKAFALGFPILFTGVALFIFTMALGMSGIFGFLGFEFSGAPGFGFAIIPAVMSLVPLGMAAIGVAMFFAMRKKMRDLESSPLLALPAIVVDKRTHVSGGSGDSSARTTYYVTCELEDGVRKEYALWDGNLYGRMAPQDAGVVFVRADFALDFDRVLL